MFYPNIYKKVDKPPRKGKESGLIRISENSRSVYSEDKLIPEDALLVVTGSDRVRVRKQAEMFCRETANTERPDKRVNGQS